MIVCLREGRKNQDYRIYSQRDVAMPRLYNPAIPNLKNPFNPFNPGSDFNYATLIPVLFTSSARGLKPNFEF